MYSCILVCIFVTSLNVLYNTDACSLPAPRDVCQDVSCQYGSICSPYNATWCQNGVRLGDSCYPPVPVCGVNMNPCTVTLCPVGTLCFSVKDQCSDNGGCTIKAQCEAVNKPGTCPPPSPLNLGGCFISCENDALCPSGMKCCPGLTDFGIFKSCLELPSGR